MCIFIPEVVEWHRGMEYTLEVMASSKVKSFLVCLIVSAGIKICMYEAKCDNVAFYAVATYVILCM